MAWIESHQSLSRHRKTIRAATLLNVNRHRLIGHLHEIWWWGLDNLGSDGNLHDLSDQEIADAAEWPKSAANFVSVLTQVGFIDEKNGERFLHDWYQYAGKLMDRREANKQRMRDARSPHVQRTCETRAPATVPTVPNRTQPTVPIEEGVVPVSQPEKKAKSTPKRAVGVTPEYLAEMAKEFPMLNVDRIYRLKFSPWCKQHQKQETQRRLLDWLERDAKDLALQKVGRSNGSDRRHHSGPRLDASSADYYGVDLVREPEGG